MDKTKTGMVNRVEIQNLFLRFLKVSSSVSFSSPEIFTKSIPHIGQPTFSAYVLSPSQNIGQ